MRALALLGLLALAASCESGEPPMTASQLGALPGQRPDGAIAFASDRGGSSYEIYLMNPGGTGFTRLTKNTAWDDHPSWSPDGRQIAFYSDRDGNFEIYVMNANGTRQIRLTRSSPFASTWPSWCGNEIAFGGTRDGANGIYVITPHGTGAPRRVTAGSFPAWSPTCEQIAFSRGGEIYVISADGTGETRLTDNTGTDAYPAWSPDGGRIAFTSYRDFNGEIYVINADGTGERRLTNDGSGGFGAPYDEFPSWSPSGQIVFTSTRGGGNAELYAMNADGTGLVRLTTDAFNDSKPAWSGRCLGCGPPPH